MSVPPARIDPKIGKVMINDDGPIVEFRDQFWHERRPELLEFADDHKCVISIPDRSMAFSDGASFNMFKFMFESCSR